MSNSSSNISVYDAAQEGLVSTLLYLPGRASDAASLVDPEDFSNGRLGTIYKAMVKLVESNKTPDLAGVITWLDKHGELAQAGGVEEIQRLFSDGALNGSMSSVENYARVIKNAASKQRISKTLAKANETANDSRGNAKDIIENTRHDLDTELLSLVTDTNTVDVSDYYDDYVEQIKRKKKIYQETGGNPLAAENGIPSGFPTIDENVGGWLPGQMLVVGARTGIGKSFFLVDAAINAAHAGAPVLFMSLEMMKDELMNRFVAANSNVRLSGLKHGSLTDEELEKVIAAKKDFEELPIEIDTTPNITIDHIRAKAQQMASSPTGLGIIMIDYLQLITARRGGDQNRERQVAEISRGIKLLAMQLKVPILVAVQLNRLHKGDEDPIPTVDDIRESNSIAQDASAVILIHRDTKQNEGRDPSLFIIGKNRNGSSGIRFRCQTMLNYAKFVEIKKDADFDDVSDNDSNQKTNDTINDNPTSISAPNRDASPINNDDQTDVTEMFGDDDDDEF